ncbi:MAG: N-acetyl-1-D-myo-inositol-2-amino-2-deoxy-alpha-D-glucopyranoside deacetylase [Actinobacteria bacterium]|nr:N-acetyl-1-D-myo-inositol-2-amino-2-deoxy-alpha-D-glucopyranoside deacetylase [Actinomycetota bacterium]
MIASTQPRLLLVHAHPDDESINNGATMAAYVARGAQVTLVTCTRGEEGEILVPELSHLASDKEDGLGAHREIELAAAMNELGVSDFRFLGAPVKKWRDSGMIGTPQNERPDAFWNSDLDEAARHLEKIILEIKPHVLITYDENGGYGHPDHIKAHQVAMRAAELARTSGWEIKKIYWNTIPISVIEEGIAAMKGTGVDFFGVEKAEDFPFAAPDHLVTTVFNGDEFVAKKMAAMKAHPTQIAVDGPFFALSDNLGFRVWGREFYRLVHGEKSGPFDEAGRELDLFAGVELN